MPTIRGTFPLNPRDDRWAACVWCGQQTFVWMATPGRPDLGEVPCHGLCAAEIIEAYNDWLASRRIDAAVLTRLASIRLIGA